MKHVYIVTMGANNRASQLQFAFHNLDEANKFRAYLDFGKGGSSVFSTIHAIRIYDAAIQLMKDNKCKE